MDSVLITKNRINYKKGKSILPLAVLQDSSLGHKLAVGLKDDTPVTHGGAGRGLSTTYPIHRIYTSTTPLA